MSSRRDNDSGSVTSQTNRVNRKGGTRKMWRGGDAMLSCARNEFSAATQRVGHCEKEIITDEQIQRILEPVFIKISEGKFDKTFR